MATTTVIIYVHVRRFRLFLLAIEALTWCGVIDEVAAYRIVERWALAILAPYAKDARGGFRLWI